MSCPSENAPLSPLQRASREGQMGKWPEDVWRKVGAYIPKMKAYIRSRHSPNEEDDITQQVLLKALRASHKGLDEPQCVPAYLHQMASNEISERYRKECVPRTGEPRKVVFTDNEMQDAFFKDLESNPTNPIAALQLQEIQKRVKTLRPEYYQDVFRLHFMEGFTFPEIAQKLGRSEQTLKVAAFRLRKMLEAPEHGGHSNGLER